MSVPILKQGKILIATLQGSATDADLMQLRDELTRDVRRYRSSGVIIDVTLLEIVDSFAARVLRGLSQVTRLLGAQAVIVGIQPDVAFSMVQLGLTLEGIKTALDLEDGLALLADRGLSSDGE